VGRAADGTLAAAAFHRELEHFLAERVFSDWSAVKVTSLTRATGGLSWETHVADVVDPQRAATVRRVVVKRPPLDGPLAPYDLQREGVLLGALIDSQVPVARLLAYTAEPELCGRQVEVSEFVDGQIPELRVIEAWDAWRDERRRHGVTEALMRVLAELQAFEWRTPEVSAVLDGHLAPAEHVAVSVDRLMRRIDDNVASGWAASPVLRDASRWLAGNVPPLGTSRVVVVHGDFRIGNVIWQDDEVVALLDWERAGLGHPMADLGFFCMPMARRRSPKLMGMLAPARELLDLYEGATGQAADLRALHFYLVYWQFVELAQVSNAIPYGIDRAPDDDLTGLTSYPLLSSGAVDLIELIDRFEDGDHELR
jgi:aminoglycoside phosphotransferase (APT) family kinase protein